MKIVLIQPPLVQLNSPYPSIYYLRSFLAKGGHEVKTRDHSIALFEKIFSRPRARADRLKIFTLNRKDRLAVAE